MIIYKAINKINSKVYIGQTVSPLKKRIANHLVAKNGLFPAALQKYGIQSFEISIIDQASSKEILETKERYWISQYNCKAPAGYNLTDGGDGGFKRCEETCNKMSMAMTGKHPNEETRKKLSAAVIGEKNPNWGKFGENNPLFGRKRPDTGARNKLWVGDKNPMWGRYHTEETRRKISEAEIGEKNHNWGKIGKENPMFGKTGRKCPNFGRKRPDVAIRNKLRSAAIRRL